MNRLIIIPGFIVMKIPHDQTRSISRPSNTNLCEPAANALRIDRICWATTDNTSILILLNSSKHPQAPVCIYHSYTIKIKWMFDGINKKKKSNQWSMFRLNYKLERDKWSPLYTLKFLYICFKIWQTLIAIMCCRWAGLFRDF